MYLQYYTKNDLFFKFKTILKRQNYDINGFFFKSEGNFKTLGWLNNKRPKFINLD